MQNWMFSTPFLERLVISISMRKWGIVVTARLIVTLSQLPSHAFIAQASIPGCLRSVIFDVSMMLVAIVMIMFTYPHVFLYTITLKTLWGFWRLLHQTCTRWETGAGDGGQILWRARARGWRIGKTMTPWDGHEILQKCCPRSEIDIHSLCCQENSDLNIASLLSLYGFKQKMACTKSPVSTIRSSHSHRRGSCHYLLSRAHLTYDKKIWVASLFPRMTSCNLRLNGWAVILAAGTPLVSSMTKSMVQTVRRLMKYS